MRSIFTILWDFEKLIYKVLMWLILIPKTIVQIALQPGWVQGYVAHELSLTNKPDQETEEVPFGEYISPVLLLLIVALIPAFVFNFLPTFGSAVSSPAEANPTTDRFLTFESVTEFKSTSTDMDYFHTWVVEKIQPDGNYAVIYREDHYPGSPNNFIDVVNTHTVKDRFLYTFPDLDAGEYYVDVYAGKYYPYRQDAPIVEIYKSYLKVVVPLKQDEQLTVSSSGVRSVAATGADIGIVVEETTAQRVMQVVRVAAANVGTEKESMFFIALALMIPPLLFALATQLIIGQRIAENTLKKDFYVQCYYFSLLSLAIWATLYAYYFFTADAYFFIANGVVLQILLLPLLLAMLWFFRIEMMTMSVYSDRKIGGVKSFLIVAACVVILVSGIYVSFHFINFWDRIRLFYVQAYPLFAVLLLFALFFAWFGRHGIQGSGVSVRKVSWSVVSVVVLAGAMQLVYGRTFHRPLERPVAIETLATELPAVEQTQVSELPAPTPTAIAYVPVFPDTPTPTVEPIMTETPVIVQPTAVNATDTPTSTSQPYYTEEFNADNTDWIRFMTSGDERMVEMQVALGKLSLNLLPLEDKLPWFYLINNVYTYADVKIETVITNRGIDANGISVICRYSDIGWYEFLIRNSGSYSIYAVDRVGIISQGYNELLSGNSTLINPGLSINVLTAECKGNELNLYINQTLVDSTTDTTFNLSQGKIGLAVSSPEKLPVSVDFESLTVSETSAQ